MRALVQCVPEALSHIKYHKNVEIDEESVVPIDEMETLPILLIQQAIHDYNRIGLHGPTNFTALLFIPILAEEGAKHNVGGVGMRGGLLCKEFLNGGGQNVLQYLVHPLLERRERIVEIDYESYDWICLAQLRRLRELDLFKKEDIKQYRLLSIVWNDFVAKSIRKKTFEYLVDWDPDALNQRHWHRNETLLHGVGGCDRIPFQMILEAGLKHYPHEIGFLLHKSDCGESALERAYKRIGEKDAWNAIKDCLEKTDTKKVLQRNPRTNMYPFMVAAMDGSVGCLDVAYYLLRKNPMVLRCAEK